MGRTWYGRTEEERFWVKVEKPDDPEGCWIWTAHRDGCGYGCFLFHGLLQKAHRVSYVIANGEIPKDENGKTLCVIHHCKNHACVRPDHLFVEKQTDYNARQAVLNAEARFWSRVNMDVGEDECWEWQGSKSGGYGNFQVKSRYVKAHRFAWEITYGEIPKGDGPHGTCVLHHCDNPACVRPDHLFLGSNLDNVRDKQRKGRAVSFQGEKHGMARLTEKQVIEIRGNVGKSDSEYSKELGVTPQAIRSIRKGITWKHLLRAG